MKVILIILSFLTFSITGNSQNNYFVSLSGDDNNIGDLSNTWRTIQHGANQLVPGDTLNILAGTYEEKIDLDISGNASAYITIRNYQNDAVILDAINLANNSSIIWTDNAYLKIIGLHLTNNIGNNKEGLTLQGTAHHIEILNNKISNIKFSSDPNAPITSDKNAVPLNIWADSALDSIHNIIIRGNEVFNNQTGYSENIAAGGNFSTFIIENNSIHDNTNIGIDIGGNYNTSPSPQYDHGRHGIIRNNIVYNCSSPYSTAAGIYIDGGHNIIVENNICHHNGYGGEIGCEEDGTTENIIFRNNIFYENFYAGLHIGGYDTNTTGTVLNSKVFNNTFYNNDIGENYNGELILSKSNHCKIMNNIFFISSQNVLLYAYREQENFTMNYNLIYNPTSDPNSIETTINETTSITGLSNFYTVTGYGNNSVFSNPLFTDSTSSDFHILTNSLAIDSGDPAYVMGITEVDMDNENRINNSRIDCGADEYKTLLELSDLYSQTIEIYPNPSSEKIIIKNKIFESNYKIFSTNGQLLDKGIIKSNCIDISNLSNGIYFLSLSNSRNTSDFIKIIKN
jgi:hypothetical protein